MDKLKSFTNKWSSKEDGNASNDPAVRRKEQVRRAQQTYRHRKESYIKSLEREVVNLRASKADLATKNRALTAEVERLRQAVQGNGIPLPPGPESFASLTSNGWSDGVSGSGSPSGTATVFVNRDQLNNTRLVVLDDDSSMGSSPGWITDGNGNGAEMPGSHWGSPGGRVQGDVITAMNFILSLEGPCLDHVRDALGTPEAEAEPETESSNVHGHALTLTASVFRLYRHSSLPLDNDQLLSVSKQTLERLLELSSHLTPAGELTPIQIWALLSQDPAFVNGGPERILAISGALLQYAKCHEYGAVIPREVVLDVAYQILQ